MSKLVLATHNPAKVKEYRSLLQGLPCQMVTLKEEGIEATVSEEGNTLEENARRKAIAYAQFSGLLTLADDSGLEVDALGAWRQRTKSAIAGGQPVSCYSAGAERRMQERSNQEACKQIGFRPKVIEGRLDHLHRDKADKGEAVAYERSL